MSTKMSQKWFSLVVIGEGNIFAKFNLGPDASANSVECLEGSPDVVEIFGMKFLKVYRGLRGIPHPQDPSQLRLVGDSNTENMFFNLEMVSSIHPVPDEATGGLEEGRKKCYSKIQAPPPGFDSRIIKGGGASK